MIHIIDSQDLLGSAGSNQRLGDRDIGAANDVIVGKRLEGIPRVRIPYFTAINHRGQKAGIEYTVKSALAETALAASSLSLADHTAPY